MWIPRLPLPDTTKMLCKRPWCPVEWWMRCTKQSFASFKSPRLLARFQDGIEAAFDLQHEINDKVRSDTDVFGRRSRRRA